jgi:hypothetical protein
VHQPISSQFATKAHVAPAKGVCRKLAANWLGIPPHPSQFANQFRAGRPGCEGAGGRLLGWEISWGPAGAPANFQPIHCTSSVCSSGMHIQRIGWKLVGVPAAPSQFTNQFTAGGCMHQGRRAAEGAHGLCWETSPPNQTHHPHEYATQVASIDLQGSVCPHSLGLGGGGGGGEIHQE